MPPSASWWTNSFRLGCWSGPRTPTTGAPTALVNALLFKEQKAKFDASADDVMSQFKKQESQLTVSSNQ